MKSEPYNIALLNTYLLSLMRTHLTPTQYDVLRLSYGLDCDKHSANEIASKIGVNVATAHVRISQIKRDAIQVLINNVDSSQVCLITCKLRYQIPFKFNLIYVIILV